METGNSIGGFLGAICGLTVVLLIIPGLPPDYEFKSFHIAPPRREYLDLLHSNNVLDEAELYYEGPNNGIESILEIDENTIIGADQSGAIFKVTGKQKAVNITHLKYPCTFSSFGGGGEEGNENCGWPLGMQLDLDGNIMLMDFFGGMVKVNIETGTYKTIVPSRTVFNDKVSLIPEDLSIAKDGTVYWTDGSTDTDFFSEMLGQPSGRLIKYDRKRKTNTVLLDDLHFSNGVCLSDNDEFVLVAEMGSAKIRRYYLKGSKKGKSDTFIEGLPGYPDNIRSNGDGGFYVALFNTWNDEFSLRTHIFSELPKLRKIILRLRNIIVSGITFIKSVLPGEMTNVFLNDVERYVLELQPILRLPQKPKTAIIAELSKTGELIGLYHGKSGKMPNLSQLTVGKTYGWLVCPFDNKIWRIKMDSLRKLKKSK